jgi:ML domain
MLDDSQYRFEGLMRCISIYVPWAALVLLIGYVSRASAWSLCTDQRHFNVTAVSLVPPTKQDHDVLNLAVHGIPAGDISGGVLTVQVYYLGIHVYTTSSDACNSVACPLLAGQAVSFTTKQRLPGIAPHGKYRMVFSAVDHDMHWLCVDVSFNFAAV